MKWAIGERVQYSLFLVSAKPAKTLRLKKELIGIIDGRDDSVIVIDLGIEESISQARIEQLGRRVIKLTADSYIV